MGNGDIGHIVRGYQTDYKRLYASNPENAMVIPVTLVQGFGVIPAGTPLAKVTGDGPAKGKYVPYNPTTPSSAVKNTGRTYLVADTTSSAIVYTTLEDSYRFEVGDQLYVSDSDTTTSSATNCGVITAIDRTTYSHMAKITVTTTLAADFTVALSASIFHKAGASNANTWSDAAGILDVAVDTGVGENAKGGLGSMVIKNAMLYDGMCPNVDSAAETDLSATVNGQFLII
jgi:hypothetical protein